MSKHKDSFKALFKTVTLTLGSLSGCLRRATNLSSDEVSAVVDRIDKACHLLSVARRLTFQAVEYLVYKTLDEEPEEVESGVAETGVTKKETKMDPLDLILDRSHGCTLIRNLLSIFLNGPSANQMGPKPKSVPAKQAQELAAETYGGLKNVLSNLPTLNDAVSPMPLSIPKADLAVEIHTAIREHFGRLPVLVTKKVRSHFLFSTETSSIITDQ
jgi:hypothetical protein